ncbi:tetratricopeptide repeat protein [Chitinophaga pollutisoli]|uniref:Tetratricopeptide repeat protein n=1 Tax=Chitinophaga pollutisoli TaxID=3133966 RepID=A0ABZ2YP23_9BACT
MEQNLIDRAVFLMQHRKYREAETAIQQSLARYPMDVNALGLLAEVKIQLDEHDEALQIVNDTIGIDPTDDRLYYQRARIHLNKEQFDAAEADLRESIRLDPQEASYYAIYAMVLIQRKKFAEALSYAEQALQVDPENVYALNARSTALLKLNRKQESFEGMEDAFRHDPENAYTHANYGWGLLEKGDAKKALEHFRESLRIDPSMSMAQAGMIEALKSRYLVYRLFLKYAFFMSKLSEKFQWIFIIGLYLATKFLSNTAQSNPELAPYLMPVVYILIAFAFSTWIMEPVSNLFLRFNKYGRYMLDRKEISASNGVAVSLAVAVIGAVGLFTVGGAGWLAMTFAGISYMIPLSVRNKQFKQPALMQVFIYGLGVLALGAIASGFITGEAFSLWFLIYAGGFIAFQWIVNFAMIRRNNR